MSNLLPTIFSITESELDLDALLDQITFTSTGAAAIFAGMVRGRTLRNHPHETDYLEYEAYKPMAEAKMKQVADEIRELWDTVEGIAIVQRIGRLYPRTPTILVACTAAHRDTGVFDAAKYGIDRLKEIVPVWKKEFGPQGEEWLKVGIYQKRGSECRYSFHGRFINLQLQSGKSGFILDFYVSYLFFTVNADRDSLPSYMQFSRRICAISRSLE